jgi:hypothetical protein
MAALRPFVVAMAVMTCCAVERAQASCAITLEGDTEVVERVRRELGIFADDGSSCLALWVQCRSNGSQLEIDLHDELGRSSLHLFASAAGAAAFIISWSRRPLLPRPASIDRLAPPGTTTSRPAAASTPLWQDQPWHPELALGYVVASGPLHNWGTVTASLTRRSGLLGYGVAVRGIIGGVTGSASGDAEVMVGAGDALSERFTARCELVIGSTLAADATIHDLGYGTRGIRGTLRGMIGWPITASLVLEAGLGYDLVRRVDESSPTVSLSNNRDLFAGFAHLDLGIRWVP